MASPKSAVAMKDKISTGAMIANSMPERPSSLTRAVRANLHSRAKARLFAIENPERFVKFICLLHKFGSGIADLLGAITRAVDGEIGRTNKADRIGDHLRAAREVVGATCVLKRSFR